MGQIDPATLIALRMRLRSILAQRPLPVQYQPLNEASRTHDPVALFLSQRSPRRFRRIGGWLSFEQGDGQGGLVRRRIRPHWVVADRDNGVIDVTPRCPNALGYRFHQHDHDQSDFAQLVQLGVGPIELVQGVDFWSDPASAAAPDLDDQQHHQPQHQVDAADDERGVDVAQSGR